VTTTATILICGYGGGPQAVRWRVCARADKTSPPVGITHDADGCWGRFLTEALDALDALKAQTTQ
jgi:hypothetical protein